MMPPTPPDVFLSYSRLDEERARMVVAALEAYGLSVWWDRQLVAGDRFRERIREALDGSRSVVVLWSRHSVSSTFVQAEAERAMNTGKLVPALLERVVPEMPFGQCQTSNLSGWTGNAADSQFADLLRGLSRLIPSLQVGPNSVRTAAVGSSGGVPMRLDRLSLPESEAFAGEDLRHRLRTLNATGTLAIDEGAALYVRPDMGELTPEELSTICSESAPAPRVIQSPMREMLEQLNHSANDKKVAAFLRKKARMPLRPNETIRLFETKVGVRRIELPLPRLLQPLRLHLEPLSFWTVDAFNRALLIRPTVETGALRHDALMRLLTPSQVVLYPCPSALYVEVALITGDDRLVVLEKNPAFSALARTGRCWTSSLEEGFVWHEDVSDGALIVAAAVHRGLRKELHVEPDEISSIQLHGVALECTHLNSAVLGTVRLRLTSAQLNSRIDSSPDFGLGRKFVPIREATDWLFRRSDIPSHAWHPTARMRALLTLYSLFGRRETLSALGLPTH